GLCPTRAPAATTGCCSTTCARKAWRCPGSAPGVSSSASTTAPRTSRPSPTASSPPPAPWSATAGGGRRPASPMRASGARSCARCSRPGSPAPSRPSGTRLLLHLLLDIEHRVDELAPQQRQRRAVVEQEVVERVGEDLRHPHQPGLHVAQEEE